MNTSPTALLRHLRSLQPDRNLEEHEARSVAEKQALRLLQILGQIEPAVDVSALADLPRIEVRVAPNLPVSGFSQWTGGRWLIAVNRDDSPTRRRFTLAHEFKHVLDHPFIDHAYLDRKGKPDAEFAETICDYFAACLLMPRPWIKRAWINGVQDQAALAAAFQVSEPAMAIRLRQLGLTEPRSRFDLGKATDAVRDARRRYLRRDPRRTVPEVGTWVGIDAALSGAR